MKYRMRKTGFGKYEIYYLKDYGNGYSREHVTTCDTREDAEKELENLNRKEVNGHDDSAL